MDNRRFLLFGLLSPVVGLIGLISPRYAMEIVDRYFASEESSEDTSGAQENESEPLDGFALDQMRIGGDFRRAIGKCVPDEYRWAP